MCGVWERDGAERQWHSMCRLWRYVDVGRDGVS